MPVEADPAETCERASLWSFENACWAPDRLPDCKAEPIAAKSCDSGLLEFDCDDCEPEFFVIALYALCAALRFPDCSAFASCLNSFWRCWMPLWPLATLEDDETDETVIEVIPFIRAYRRGRQNVGKK